MSRTLGRYELIRPLARGGMAEVFLARRRGPGGVEKRLVIKRIRRERATDPLFATLFVQEARLSMSFAHRNIVPVFDFGRVGDELFLVMEYVSGVSLAAALARARALGKPLDPLVIAFIGLEACQALDYAHHASGLDGAARTVIHRDVTPNNIYLSFSGEVKLLDFGVATQETDLGEVGRVRGTPGYMSPEQARGEAIDVRTDLFSLGLCMWEAVALRRAYVGADATALLASARQAEVGPLEDERVPAPLRALIEKATRAAPAARFADAREMQGALDEFLVTARAAAAVRSPPSQMLSAWLADAFPDRAENSEIGPAPDSPDGEVFTFLDDGLEGVAGSQAGHATMRSMAATMAEPEVRVVLPASTASVARAAEAVAPAVATAPATSGRRRAAWLVGALGVAGTITVVAVVWGHGAGEAAPPTRPPIAARAAAPVDAGPHLIAVRAVDAAPVGTAARAADAGAAPGHDKLGHDKLGHDKFGHDKLGHELPAGHDAGPRGSVRVSTSPWAKVRVKGRPETCAETPCSLSLPPGRYTLELSNPVANLGTTVSVEVVSGETATVRETLTRPL